MLQPLCDLVGVRSERYGARSEPVGSRSALRALDDLTGAFEASTTHALELLPALEQLGEAYFPRKPVSPPGCEPSPKHEP